MQNIAFLISYCVYEEFISASTSKASFQRVIYLFLKLYYT